MYSSFFWVTLSIYVPSLISGILLGGNAVATSKAPPARHRSGGLSSFIKDVISNVHHLYSFPLPPSPPPPGPGHPVLFFIVLYLLLLFIISGRDDNVCHCAF